MMVEQKKVLVSMVLCLMAVTAWAGDGDTDGLRLGVHFGLASPSENVESIYSWSTITEDPIAVYDVAAPLGTHLDARLSKGLSDNVNFVASIGWNYFPNGEQRMSYTTTTGVDTSITFKTTMNVIPVTAGAQLFLFKAVVKPYVCGDVMYNWRNVTISDNEDIVSQIIAPGQEIEEKVSRIGATLGAGIAINLAIIEPVLEFKYVWSNLIGKDEGEESINFLNVTLGVTF
jgi:hypothetical protein